ncbi:conserved hypothetical protein [Talaromyces stipitatus ATCC 10500]|uniref:RTA1 domain protein n=1 Tax=Talaromyces stipitatus (strain ATCC 10500 / CBS 375.48 / QM 6759 / NRRL 1006) TaxID=441959 RepID=B8MA97_TALSN|nr:uncharacterized protein TSTA_123310 [Talaromyces stipitatus ATCC 10500]EED18599.1 conserved hypothetical protein [Talaromyces stipitatus ATCC 10500]
MALFAGLSAARIWHTWRHKSFWIGLVSSLGEHLASSGDGSLALWPADVPTWSNARNKACIVDYGYTYYHIFPHLLLSLTTAGIYGILGLMIPIIDQDKSRLSPKLYLVIFMTVEFFSLLLQAVGGGVAGLRSAKTHLHGQVPIPYRNHLATSIDLCLCHASEIRDIPGRNRILRNPALRLTSLAPMIPVTCMVARGVDRSMELMNGWHGYLFTHEVFAIVLDAGAHVYCESGDFDSKG